MDESTQNEQSCPRCGVPLADDLHAAMHEGEPELCKYVADLKEKADERDKAVAMMKRWIHTRSKWQIRAEKAEGELEHEIECWKNERAKLIRSRKEIARIPEWLREEGTPHGGWNEKHRGILDSIASMIEREKHLKGMKDE